jgi:taurine dehydrogenase small subunit
MTREEGVIHRYFDAFNRHDIEGVMACFHEEPVLIGANGKRCAGRAEVRRSYETEFAMFPDGHSWRANAHTVPAYAGNRVAWANGAF